MKDGLLAIVKFFCFLLLIPIIIAAALSFKHHLLAIPLEKSQWLYWGGGLFTLCFFFIYNFQEVYQVSQGIVMKLLGFLGPAAGPFSLAIPIAGILLISVLLILDVLKMAGPYESYFLLLISFALLMHLVLAARQLYEEDKGPLKANYLLSFGMVFILNLCIFVLLLALVIPDIQIAGFFKGLVAQTKVYYQYIYKLLFVSPA